MYRIKVYIVNKINDFKKMENTLQNVRTLICKMRIELQIDGDRLTQITKIYYSILEKC